MAHYLDKDKETIIIARTSANLIMAKTTKSTE
jgi:hypothetical protein